MKKNKFSKLAYRYFGRLAIPLADTFSNMKQDLKKSDIKLSLVEYLSLALFASTISFFVSVPLVSVFVAIRAGPDAIAGILIASFFVGLTVASGTFTYFYLYPSLKVTSRKKNIDSSLPFATMYLSTMAGRGTPPAALFSLLAEFEEYGEIAKEAKKISRDVNSFGADITTALIRASQRTPSDTFKELLWGVSTMIRSGGDLRAFLRAKSQEYMNTYRRELDKFTQTLTLFVEIYITLVIVGSVFLIVLSSIMGALQLDPGLVVFIQIFGVFVFLPSASLGFIALVKSISPVTS